jgi:4-diphosphocytidyl-2-C-methyl-D-erythritol kinase
LSAPADPLVEAAPAKLNLYLHVVGRRADSYHLLDSLVAFTGYGDSLRAMPADELSLALDGPFAAVLDGESLDANLAFKAARLLRAKAARGGASLVLTKNLPVAAGLGGGSADAGAALRLLRRLWRVDIGDAALAELAQGLGSDVPVCVRSAPAYFGGVGEVLSEAPVLPPAGVVLVNPGVPLSTPKVFGARQEPFSDPGRLDRAPRDVAELAARLAERRNDLEPAAISLVPVVATVLAALAASPGCRLARMAGSGATCFGLYDSAGSAAAAAEWLAARQRGWWIKSTYLGVS